VDINYKLVLDTVEFNQSVQSGLNQLRLLNDELSKTKSTAGQAFTSSALDTDKLAAKMQEVINLNGQMLSEFQKLGAAIKGATSTNEVQQLNSEIAKLKAQIDALSNSAGGGSGLGGKMGNLKNQLVQLRMEGKQNTDQYQKLNAEYSKMVANITAVENASKQYRNTNKELVASVDDTGRVAALAGANVISFGQILSDLPYGIRGIANNMQQLTATMVTLVVQAGGLRAAMVALRTTFLGPLGIIVAVQGAIAALDLFAGSTEKAKKKTDEAKSSNEKYLESLTKQTAEFDIMIGALDKMVKSGEDVNKIKSLAKEINDKYNTTLDTERVTLEAINKARNEGNKFLLDKINLEIVTERLAASRRSELQAQDAINKYTIERAEKEAEIARLKKQQTTDLENYEALRVLIVRAEGESESLGLKIAAIEKNKEGHLKNQDEYLRQAEILYKRIYKADDENDKKAKKRTKDKEKSWKTEETFAEAWEKLQKEQYELGVKLAEESFLKKKDILSQEYLSGLLSQDEYNKNIENLEAQKFEELLNLSNAYNANIAESENALTEQRIKMFEKALAEIEKKRKEVEKNKDKRGAIAKLLGVEDKDVEVILRNIRIIGKELANIFNEFNEAAQRNNKNVIESLDDVIAKTEEKIETETELQQMGLANNLEAEKAYLDQQKQLREEAYERQKQLELQKLAIDSISQLSSLITAAAQIWQATSKAGVLSPVLAGAAIAAMFTSFGLSKVKAAQLVKSQESFEEGGVVEGRRHTQGGERFYSADGNHMVEIEQGEYVTNRESTRKYMDLLHAINNDEIGSHNIHKLLEGTGVTVPSMDTEAFKKDLKVISTGNSSPKQSATNTPDLSQDIRDIKNYVKGIAAKESIVNDGDKTIVKKGSHTKIIRRGN